MLLSQILLKCKFYSPKIAKHFGVEEAAMITEIFKNHGLEPFKIDYKLCTNIGISKLSKQTKIWGSLIYLKLVIEQTKDVFILNESLIVSTLGGDGILGSDIFQDSNFLTLVKKWNEIIKEKHGRGKTKTEINSLFQNRSLQESIEALNYACNNRFVSLFFKEKENDKERSEKPEGSDTRPRSSRRAWDSGGSTNKGGTGVSLSDLKESLDDTEF
jgi:hypothetical protein